MRIFLADDQANVRSALRCLFEQEPGLIIVGEAAQNDDLLAGIARARPDLLLLDWELPGLSAAPLVQRLHPAVKVIILSSRPEARRAALDAGADAFVSKGDAPECVLEAIRSLAPKTAAR